MVVMLKEVQRILSLIPNTTYADVRIIDFSSRDIATKDGVVEALSEGTSLGYGIRILKMGRGDLLRRAICHQRELTKQ